MSVEFASLQLTLVDRLVELDLCSYGDGVHQLTNFQRRLGLSTTSPGTNSAWTDLLSRIVSARRHGQRVDLVMDSFDSLPPAVPEHIANEWPTVGAFSIEVSGTVARTHFFSMDTDHVSPLHPTKLGQRKRELCTALSLAYASNPELAHVAGGSWMYSTQSYAGLFPSAHIRTAVVRRNRRTFQGMSHWGQFLDHRWQVRVDLADRFRKRLRGWHGGDLCSIFPIDTLEVSSPLSVFGLQT